MATGPQKDIEDSVFPAVDVEYTTVDLNATGTTELYNATGEAEIRGAYLENVGTSALIDLEVTDSSSTGSVTPGQAAGDDIAFGDLLAVNTDDTVQVNVETANSDGVDGNTTAIVSRGEPRS